MSVTTLCRLCAETKPDVIGVSDAEGEKLSIQGKIAKYLHIEIVANDGLPQCVCIDCCVLLNQCSDFYERTNQAQNSLRQLLIQPKCDPEVNESTETYPKKEDDTNLTEPVAEVNDSYFHDDDDDDNSEPSPEYEAIDPQDTKKKSTKKSSVKTPKKRVKKRASRKPSTESASDDDTDSKMRIKIPDNYMTGTELDKEMIESGTCETSKNSRKSRTNPLERHPWLCTDCNEKLASLEMLENHHQIVHNQQAKYMCVACCKVYDKYYGFLTHVKRHKNKLKFNCDDCGKSFVHKKVLDSHRTTMHSDERRHVCQTCGKSFRQQSALYIHSRCHLPETMKNRFPCDQCDKRFSTKPNLVTHKRIHSGVRNFTCDQCGKSFIQKGNLEAHFLTHSVDKPYNCNQCPKAFKTPLQLKKHETVHTGAKPHQCAVCGRTFREKGTLREHHRIHTGAMPFTCEFCGKCFRFKGILTTHRRQHTGERPYSCLECQHHFTNWPNYNKHMKRRHGINTSHTKYMQQQPPQPVVEVGEVGNIQEEVIIDPPAESVQVVQTIPVSQPIIVQSIPTTTIQTFQTEPTTIGQETTFRERNTAYFNAVPATLQTFLPPHLPYNFYNISTVSESDLIQPR